MVKKVLLIIIYITVSNHLYAKTDTVAYYMRAISDIYDIHQNYDIGTPAAKKEEATFIRFIISPDFTVDSLYQVSDYYLNGKIKFIGKSKSPNYEVRLEGPTVEYFNNGHTKRICTFKNGSLTGDIMEYFPGGKINTIKTMQDSDKLILKKCLDSAGNVLANDGNGKWIEYQNNYKIPFAEGVINNGKEQGEWHGQLNDSIKYICKYNKGGLIEGKSFSNSGKEYPFTQIATVPEFPGGLNELGKFWAIPFVTLLMQEIKESKEWLLWVLLLKKMAH
jgi:hypothetical protein